VCSHEQKKCEEKETRAAHERSKREKADEKQQTERESCPRKKEAKNETKIHSFSLSQLVVVFGGIQ
jgi:hypothetical protein